MIKKMNIRPTMTLEAHNPDNLWSSIRNIESLGLLYF